LVAINGTCGKGASDFAGLDANTSAASAFDDVGSTSKTHLRPTREKRPMVDPIREPSLNRGRVMTVRWSSIWLEDSPFSDSFAIADGRPRDDRPRGNGVPHKLSETPKAKPASTLTFGNLNRMLMTEIQFSWGSLSATDYCLGIANACSATTAPMVTIAKPSQRVGSTYLRGLGYTCIRNEAIDGALLATGL